MPTTIKYSHLYFRFPWPFAMVDLVGLKKPTSSFELQGGKVAVYADSDGKIQVVSVFIPHDKSDHDRRFESIIRCVESMLRLSYDKEFRLSKHVIRLDINSAKMSDETITGILAKLPPESRPPLPRFSGEHFQTLVPLYAERPHQCILLTESINEHLSSIFRYLSLYKILESEYHAANIGLRAREALKKSPLPEILEGFEHDGRRGEALIDYIVDLRDRCSHLKSEGEIDFYGVSPVDVAGIKEVEDFLEIMREICAKFMGVELQKSGG